MKKRMILSSIDVWNTQTRKFVLCLKTIFLVFRLEVASLKSKYANVTQSLKYFLTYKYNGLKFYLARRINITTKRSNAASMLVVFQTNRPTNICG